MEELFDIVDENDAVIGRASRKEAHAVGHIHRSVLFFIFNGVGRIFVNRRSLNKEFYPGYWSIVFGGHVHAGESYEEAVARELKEEAGIEEEPYYLASFKKRFDDRDKENVHVFKITTDRPLTIDRDEIECGEFMARDELREKIRNERFLPETARLLEILECLNGR